MPKKDDRASRTDSDNPEWTRGDFRTAVPALKAVVKAFGRKVAEMLRRGRPKVAKPKVNQMDFLTSEQAMLLVAQCRRDGRRILGIDGFIIVPEGYIASLDLILDVSHDGVSADEAANALETFIATRSAPDVRFEIVVD
jgi:hypothetical protein